LLGLFSVFDMLNTHGHHLAPGKSRRMKSINMPASRRPSRSTISVKIDAEIAARFRELCLNYSGLPHFLRQNEIIDQCLRQFITEFERKLAEGDATKPRDRIPPSRNSLHH
jgi:hypothetical protein